MYHYLYIIYYTYVTKISNVYETEMQSSGIQDLEKGEVDC